MTRSTLPPPDLSGRPLRCTASHDYPVAPGVLYRAWTVRMAARFGLRGWVRNRADGTVEALVIGDEPSVAAMVDACRRGPLAASAARRSPCTGSCGRPGSPPWRSPRRSCGARRS